MRTLGLVLAYTGCRISEALELTPRRIDRAIEGAQRTDKKPLFSWKVAQAKAEQLKGALQKALPNKSEKDLER